MTAMETMPDLGIPTNTWMMTTGGVFLWFLLLGYQIGRTAQTRTLSLYALFFVAATLSFWQEFYGDWGNYQIWNPHFERLPFWGNSPYTTAVKPAWMPFSWGWFLGLMVPALCSLAFWAKRRLPAVPLWVLSIPIGLFLWFFDIYQEVNATANGLWSVTRIWGPAFHSPRGSYAIVYPSILLGFFASAMILLLYKREAAAFYWHERVFNIQHMQAGWGRELARLGAFYLLFNVLFFLFQTGPIMAFRILIGGPSAIVP